MGACSPVTVCRQLSTGSISFWLAEPRTSGLTIEMLLLVSTVISQVLPLTVPETVSNRINRASFKNVFMGFKITSRVFPLLVSQLGNLSLSRMTPSLRTLSPPVAPLLALPTDQVTLVRLVLLLPGCGEYHGLFGPFVTCRRASTNCYRT